MYAAQWTTENGQGAVIGTFDTFEAAVEAAKVHAREVQDAEEFISVFVTDAGGAVIWDNEGVRDN